MTVYAPGSTSVRRTLRQGVNKPTALAFDDRGRLYVANAWANTVTVYAPVRKQVLRVISDGVESSQRSSV